MDPALYAMLHGEKTFSSEKSSSPSPLISEDKKLKSGSSDEEAFQKCIDELMDQQDPSTCQFLSKKALREKIEKEARETLDFSYLEEFIAKAVAIIEWEGVNYLPEESQISLVEEINLLRTHLNEFDFNTLDIKNLSVAFSLSNKGCESILQLGIKKFNEGLLSDSLALFLFLSTLNPGDADYTYRLGIIAQKNERFDIALPAYKMTSELDPKMIGPYLFAAQCYMKMNQIENAVRELTEAKKMINGYEITSEWHSLVTDIESLFLARKGG